ncbi:MAG: BON domain-containing protein [Nitrospiraceae bacterium]|nr:BON domain-containing protein [Nitrospira sp.]MCB9775262.1 BON domain-containing protein [Nitrospiraceae bacterium]
MVKGIYILKSHLDAIVCLSGPMDFAGEKTAPAFSSTEGAIDHTRHHEPVKQTVKKHLRMEEQLHSELVNIEACHRHVASYGNTKTEKPNGHSPGIATSFKRVVGVTDRKIVSPSRSKNHHLQNAVWNSLRGVDVLTQHTNTLHIHAKDGVVTLSGMVETKPQKAAAGKAAESVSGIKKVINAIHVRMLPLWDGTEFVTKRD